MPEGYLPFFIFVTAAVRFILVLLLVAKSCGRRLRLSPSWRRMSAAFARPPIREGDAVRFYIIAILFVIFDVETVFLSMGSSLPSPRLVWRSRDSSLSRYIDCWIYLGLQKGALEWV